MCRYNILWGCAFMAFGLGVLVGLWLEGGFFSFCFGLFVMALGYLALKSRHS